MSALAKRLEAQHEEIAERTFGRLKALTIVGRDKDRRTNWLCECECGSLTLASGMSLMRGNRASCGCASRGQVDHRVTYLDLFRGAGGGCTPMSTDDLAEALCLEEGDVARDLARLRDDERAAQSQAECRQ